MPYFRFDTSRSTPPGISAQVEQLPQGELSRIPTRSASEGAAFVPQETCGIPRSRFGLVWPFPLVLVVLSESVFRFRVHHTELSTDEFPVTTWVPLPPCLIIDDQSRPAGRSYQPDRRDQRGTAHQAPPHYRISVVARKTAMFSVCSAG